VSERLRNILVIEDDDDVRRVVKTLLERGGYGVVETGKPVEAVDLAKGTPLDLVLCDIAMPVLDGYGVVRALQADPATAHLPVVFLTARREPKERVNAFRFGVVDYITKPFTRDVLLGRIERVLGSLGDRPGTLDESGAGVSELLGRLEREGRSGILTLRGDGRVSVLVVQGGQVIEGVLPPTTEGDLHAEFRELDLHREDIARHNPPRLPGDPVPPVPLDELPDVFRRVLVADDSDAFRGFLRDVLVRRNFTVYEASDGEQALRLALTERPWLILADVTMPKMDGIDFCRSVRRHSIIAHTPLIFLSGWDDYKDRYAGLEAGADEYLSKDTSVRELLLRIQIIMGRLPRPDASGTDAGLRGRVEVLGAPGILQMCHLGHLTGVLRLEHEDRVGEVHFRNGELTSIASLDSAGTDALVALVSWTAGRFRFEPGEVQATTPLGPFSQLLLDACHALDEVRRQGPASS
jgi:DNA-binding response OmpR family regulator